MATSSFDKTFVITDQKVIDRINSEIESNSSENKTQRCKKSLKEFMADRILKEQVKQFQDTIRPAITEAFSKMSKEDIRKMCFDYKSFGKPIPKEDDID